MSTETFDQAWPAHFDDFSSRLAAEPQISTDLRRHARERFASLGFPSMRDEEWRHTNVAPLLRSVLSLAAVTPKIGGDVVAEWSYDGCDRLVFCDGRFSPEHSRVGALPQGVVIGSLAKIRRETPEALEPYLGRLAAFEERAFVALNTAFHDEGAVVLLPRGAVLERPLQLLFLAGPGSAGTVSYPRTLVVAGETSQATLVESWVGLTEEPYFRCAVGELLAEPGAVIDHYKRQCESRAAFHVSTQQFRLERGATLSSTSLSEGGGLVRNDIRALLAGEGSECTLNGLYLATDRQVVDHHMWVEHKEAHCNSHELFKGILDGHARAVFNGRIYVHEDAQKTDAKQTNRNLLLSKNALVQSNPQLEIFADDVRCTHGSTVGQLDEEAVFYLRSRGIPEDAARSLLTWAFASELVQSIAVEGLRRDVEEFLLGRLASADVVRQAL